MIIDQLIRLKIDMRKSEVSMEEERRRITVALASGRNHIET